MAFIPRITFLSQPCLKCDAPSGFDEGGEHYICVGENLTRHGLVVIVLVRDQVRARRHFLRLLLAHLHDLTQVVELRLERNIVGSFKWFVKP